MRVILLTVCVLGVAEAVAAQDRETRPFLSAEPSFRAIRPGSAGSGTSLGLDLTVGTRAWRGVQPIFQGGRLIDVTPADLLPHSLAGPFAQTSTWYGAAGARYLTPRVWRFQPYAESTSGVGRMSSEVEAATLVHVSRVVPVLNMGAGAVFQLAPHFTVDAGYWTQGFFGSADVARRGPRLAFGVRF